MLLWAVVLLGLAVDFAFLRGLNDADLFWHLLNGERLLATGEPVMRDPFSFTYVGGERTPHEWLSEGAMYLAINHLGPDLTLALFASLLPLGLAILGGGLLRRGVSARSVILATLLPAMVAFPYLSVRPQVISWTLLAILIGMLLWIDVGHRRWLLAVAPLFLLWANTHGLYAVGLAMLGWFTLWTLAGRTHLTPAKWWTVGALGASVGASALTPSGLPGLLYPLRFLNAGDWGLANIPEWASPNFHDAVQAPLLLTVIALALISRVRTPGWLVGLAVIGIVMALVANRNAPVAAVFSLPMLAYGIDAWIGSRTATQRGHIPRRAIEVVATATFLAGAIYVAVSNAGGVRLERFPVESVDVLSERRADARVLAEYGWGGYVAYRLHDAGGRVFVDGRNDMYPERILDDYVGIRDASEGWHELVDRYGVEAILLRPDQPLVRGVAQLQGWCEWYRDDSQVLLLRCAAT